MSAYMFCLPGSTAKWCLKFYATSSSIVSDDGPLEEALLRCLCERESALNLTTAIAALPTTLIGLLCIWRSIAIEDYGERMSTGLAVCA